MRPEGEPITKRATLPKVALVFIPLQENRIPIRKVTKVTRFSITSSLTYSVFLRKEVRKSRHFRHSMTNNNNRVAWGDDSVQDALALDFGVHSAILALGYVVAELASADAHGAGQTAERALTISGP